MKRNDPTLEALRRANPAPEESTTGWHASDEGTQVAGRALAEAPEGPVAMVKPRRPRAALVLIAATAAAFAVAASFAIGARETVTPDIAKCHNELRQGSDGAIVALLGRDPVEACTEEWELSFGEPPPPNLAVCVLDGGGTGVFPYPADDMSPADACSSVGAAVLKPDLAAP